MAAELTDLETARSAILARTAPLAAQRVPLAEALGRTLAEPIEAEERVPGYDNSAMDGYAVREADLAGARAESPARLQLVGESRAGSPADRELGAGEAIAISTGAMVPDGATAVVRVEDTESDGRSVAISVEVAEGSNIRRAGEDIEPGNRLLEAGTTLGAAELGVLASVGVAEPSCRRSPRVQILGTGDELVGVSEPLPPGAVRNSNFYALSALTRSSAAEPLPMAVATDRFEQTVAEVSRGLEADVLIVSGGISVGEHDHVRAAFTELGVEEVFWRVSLKPGKPAYFGTAPETLVFGLPGNPVSAFVTFLLFVRPALLALQGAEPSRMRTTAELTRRYEKPADRAHAIRCRLELGTAGWLATPAPHQGSHVMTSLVGADALAVIDADTTVVEAGERVTVELLDRAA